MGYGRVNSSSLQTPPWREPGAQRPLVAGAGTAPGDTVQFPGTGWGDPVLPWGPGRGGVSPEALTAAATIAFQGHAGRGAKEASAPQPHIPRLSVHPPVSL